MTAFQPFAGSSSFCYPRVARIAFAHVSPILCTPLRTFRMGGRCGSRFHSIIEQTQVVFFTRIFRFGESFLVELRFDANTDCLCRCIRQNTIFAGILENKDWRQGHY